MADKKVIAKDVKVGQTVVLEVGHCVFSPVKVENIEKDEYQIFFSYYHNGVYSEVSYYPNSKLALID